PLSKPRQDSGNLGSTTASLRRGSPLSHRVINSFMWSSRNPYPMTTRSRVRPSSRRKASMSCRNGPFGRSFSRCPYTTNGTSFRGGLDQRPQVVYVLWFVNRQQVDKPPHQPVVEASERLCTTPDARIDEFLECALYVRWTRYLTAA